MSNFLRRWHRLFFVKRISKFRCHCRRRRRQRQLEWSKNVYFYHCNRIFTIVAESIKYFYSLWLTDAHTIRICKAATETATHIQMKVKNVDVCTTHTHTHTHTRTLSLSLPQSLCVAQTYIEMHTSATKVVFIVRVCLSVRVWSQLHRERERERESKHFGHFLNRNVLYSHPPNWLTDQLSMAEAA